VTAAAGARRWEIPRAPAIDHCLASSLIDAATYARLGEIPSNTQRLRWFHKDHETRVIMELRPFWFCPVTLLLAAVHHSTKDMSTTCGASVSRPRSCKTVNQICRLNTQVTKRWSIVSPAWAQRGQEAGWSSPFLANLSAVQHFLWATVQRKNLHLLGAQVFQILSQGSKWIDPMKRASYADFVVKLPEAEKLQMWL